MRRHASSLPPASPKRATDTHPSLVMVETHGHTLEAIARAFESDDTLVPTIDLIYAERNRSRSNDGGKGQDDVESK